MFILNPKSGIPIYRQLLEQVRAWSPAVSSRRRGAAFGARTRAASRGEPDDDLQGVQPARGGRAAGTNRGKPMTVAAQPRPDATPQRLHQIDPRSISWCSLQGSSNSARRSSPGSQKNGRRPLANRQRGAHLGKTFGHKRCCRGISSEVAAGDVIGVLGKNGAGKTTLLESLLGFTPPTAAACGSSGTKLPLPRAQRARRLRAAAGRAARQAERQQQLAL